LVILVILVITLTHAELAAGTGKSFPLKYVLDESLVIVFDRQAVHMHSTAGRSL
jgi:hypothetical protein